MTRRNPLALLLLLALVPSVSAQEGAGTTGAAVLHFTAGGRAAALSGAYAAESGDADVLFYNPAGLADLSGGVGFSYLSYVQEIGFGTASAAARFGRVVLGAGAAFLDAGQVDEVVPDPLSGGERGRETGRTVGAAETALRISMGVPVGDRLRFGAGAGMVLAELVGISRTAAVLDLGAQLALPRVTLAAAVRNLGGSLSGGGIADAPLPTEARLGAAFGLESVTGIGVRTSADLVYRVREGSAGMLLGVEGGLLPRAAGRVGAVGRLGWDGEEAGLGALRFGAGLSLGAVGVDYAYQSLDHLGAVHRLGVRWARRAD